MVVFFCLNKTWKCVFLGIKKCLKLASSLDNVFTFVSFLDDEEEMPLLIENENQQEDSENPLDETRLGANETALISTIPTQFENETMTIAPGEGKKPMSILTDKRCEELSHPWLFPTGKFGYRTERS